MVDFAREARGLRARNDSQPHRQTGEPPVGVAVTEADIDREPVDATEDELRHGRVIPLRVEHVRELSEDECVRRALLERVADLVTPEFPSTEAEIDSAVRAGVRFIRGLEHGGDGDDARRSE